MIELANRSFSQLEKRVGVAPRPQRVPYLIININLLYISRYIYSVVTRARSRPVNDCLTFPPSRLGISTMSMYVCRDDALNGIEPSIGWAFVVDQVDSIDLSVTIPHIVNVSQSNERNGQQALSTMGQVFS